MDISRASRLYSGFYIRENSGNNQFSYQQRRQKEIFVAPLRTGDPADLQIGNQIVFSEIEDGVECNRRGLAAFIHQHSNGQNRFFFDNHNHAFFFWMLAAQQGLLPKPLPLLHVDQHTDMRPAPQPFPESPDKTIDLQTAFHYTNFVLNVGNFIRPALEFGLFSEIIIIDSSDSFERPPPDQYILDIDMDIFSDDMAYIDEAYKLDKIRGYIKKAGLVTVATSPFFMNQQKALDLIHLLFPD